MTEIPQEMILLHEMGRKRLQEIFNLRWDATQIQPCTGSLFVKMNPQLTVDQRRISAAGNMNDFDISL